MKQKTIARHKNFPARVTIVDTHNGSFKTPTFMPVATKASFPAVSSEMVSAMGYEIVLGGNTFHMIQNPGLELIKKMGGMHRFMNWKGPMLTDSGGFQVFSIASRQKRKFFDEEGVAFRQPIDNKKILMTPEKSIEAQKVIGADIIMAFDICSSDKLETSQIRQEAETTIRWLDRCIMAHKNNVESSYGGEQSLFGIVQGSLNKELRIWSAEQTMRRDIQGLGIGGESIGFDMPSTIRILEWLVDFIEGAKMPIYTMGVGSKPSDLLSVFRMGVDMCDCVAPTRNARHGSLYTGNLVDVGDWIEFSSPDGKERINIKNACFADDERPIMESCSCYACQNYSRAYMHYLFKSNDLAYFPLASAHNLHVMKLTSLAAQTKILENSQ